MLKNSLEKTKSWTIKESVYSNLKLPQTWKNKLTYEDEVYKIISKDNNFFSYLTKLNPISPSTENIKSKFHDDDDDDKKSVNSRNTTLIKDVERLNKSDKDNACINNIKSKSFHNSITPVEYETEDIVNSKRREKHLESENRRRTTTFRTKSNEKSYSDKEKRDILDYFKEMFKLKKKTGSDVLKEITSKIKEKNEHFHFKLPNIKNAGSDHSFEAPLNSTQKSQMFKSSIYSLLLPSKYTETFEERKASNKKITTVKTNFENSKINKNKTKEYGPFLNFNYAEYNKIIEIKHPEVKKVLEDIDYYGPYYSHCPSCRNKNLDFYQTMEPHDCLNILNYLKKTRKKTVLKGSDQ